MKTPKPPKIRVQVSYRPILPRHIEELHSRHAPKPPRALPFFKEKAHTIPTKWSCYRSLLRATKIRLLPQFPDGAPSTPTRTDPSVGYHHIRRYIQRLWKKHRAQTSLTLAKMFLSDQYDLLSTLQSRDRQDLSSLSDLEHRLRQKHTKEDRLAFEKANKPRPKVRLTGGLIYPNMFRPPLPRMKPQPPHISGMIRSRIRARDNRSAKLEKYQEWGNDMFREVEFYRALGVQDEGMSGSGWRLEIVRMKAVMGESFRRDEQRANKKFTVEEMEKYQRIGKVWRRKTNEYRARMNIKKREYAADLRERKAEKAEKAKKAKADKAMAEKAKSEKAEEAKR